MEYPTKPCYCSKTHIGFTCNACVNAILEEKNRLVRENYVLSERLRLSGYEPEIIGATPIGDTKEDKSDER
jgi:hypothetical protein